MIDELLDKIQNKEYLSSLDYEKLLTLSDDSQIEKLLNTARKIRDEHFKKILLTPTISIKNIPKEKLIESIEEMEELDIPRVNFFRQYDSDEDVITASKIIKEHTNLKILVNISGEFSFDSIEELSKIGIDTISCNLSTVNTEVFKNNKPKDTLTQRIKLCQNISQNGIGLSSGLVLGIGEDIHDRLKHLRFLSNFATLEEIPIINFNTYPDFPTSEDQIIPLKEHLKLIAVTRIMYPEMSITIPSPKFKPEYYGQYINAGANSLATNNILTYDEFIEINNVIKDCGFELETAKSH